MGKILIRPELQGGCTVGGTEVISATGAYKGVISTSNITATGNTVIGDAGTDTLTVNAKLVGQLYCNDTGKTAQTLKIHNHLTGTTEIGCYEGKTETTKTSGAYYGLWQDANIGATGTGSATAILGVATVMASKTVTGGTIIGTYGQARVDGTVAGSGFVSGLYGLVEASTAMTASHVCSAWLDSHQAEAVTGSHELLYMTNNGAATMDQAIYVYGGNKITSLMELNTVSGMVSDTAETGGTSKKIKITIDGVVHYINAYTG
jgi:hypothetical protein